MERITSLPAGGEPGAHARDRGLSRAFGPCLILIFLAGITLGGVWRPIWLKGGRGAVILVGMAAGLAFTWWRGLNILARHEQGARGEEKVARVLETLPGEWKAFHSVAVSNGEVDHVLTAPAGVFMIETVNWPGRIRLEDEALMHGDRMYPGYTLEALERRAAEVAEMLELDTASVHPVVCVVGGRLAQAAERHGRVWVGEVQDLNSFLIHQTSSGISESQLVEIRRTLRQN